jgi:hypothetical protein
MVVLVKKEYWILWKDGSIWSSKSADLVGYWFEVDGVKYYLKNPYKDE